MQILGEKGSWMKDMNKELSQNEMIKKHQEEIRMFQNLGAVDKETARAAIFGNGNMSGGKAIADFTLAEASAIQQLYPEVFLDATGKSMEKFLKTEHGKRYAL